MYKPKAAARLELNTVTPLGIGIIFKLRRNILMAAAAARDGLGNRRLFATVVTLSDDEAWGRVPQVLEDILA